MRRAILALSLLASACSGRDGREALGTSSAAVIDGELDVPAKYDATILLQAELDTTLVRCTATLISPHVAVTARHCVASYEKETGFGANFAVEKLHVWYGAEPRTAFDNTVVRIVHDGAQLLPDHDLAIIVLKEAATAVPFASVRTATEPTKGESVAVAGYGVTESTTGGKRHRREDLTVSYVGPIAAIFLGPNELRVGESVCRGDSGGPLYALSSGALVAVSSRGSNGQPETTPSSQCVGSATINYFTRTDSFAALIKQTVHQTGELLWEEGQPRPEQPSVTLRACADASSCGAGYECGDGYCLRLPEPEKPVEPAPAGPADEQNGCAMNTRGHHFTATLGLVALAGLLLRRRH